MAEETLTAAAEGASAPSPAEGPTIDIPAAVPNPDPLVTTVVDLTDAEAAELRALRAEEAALRAEIDAITGNLREKFLALHERTRETWVKVTKAHGLDLTKRVYALSRKEGKPILKDMGPVPEGTEFDLATEP